MGDKGTDIRSIDVTGEITTILMIPRVRPA